MKTGILIIMGLFFLIPGNTLISQKIYPSYRGFITGEFNRNTGLGGYVVTPKGWTPYFSYQAGELNVKNLPSDFRLGHSLVQTYTFLETLGNLFGANNPGRIVKIFDEMPADYFQSLTLGIGRSLFPDWDRGFVIASAGLGYLHHNMYEFQPNQNAGSNPFYIPSNYIYKETTTSTAAFELGIIGTVNMFRCMDIGAGLHTNFSGKRIIMQPSIILQAGLLREKRVR